MMSTLEELELKREGLYKQLQETGDFRRGIISVTYRKCGKKNCACAQEGHPGHGPQHLWNTTIKGKSYAKSLKLGPEMEKYLEEIANHQRFMKLSNELVELNERICDLRPIPEMRDDKELVALKKKLQQMFLEKYKKK
jgi:uncharacterized protein YdcH (DUF465 family)